MLTFLTPLSAFSVLCYTALTSLPHLLGTSKFEGNSFFKYIRDISCILNALLYSKWWLRARIRTISDQPLFHLPCPTPTKYILHYVLQVLVSTYEPGPGGPLCMNFLPQQELYFSTHVLVEPDHAHWTRSSEWRWRCITGGQESFCQALTSVRTFHNLQEPWAKLL